MSEPQTWAHQAEGAVRAKARGCGVPSRVGKVVALISLGSAQGRLGSCGGPRAWMEAHFLPTEY